MNALAVYKGKVYDSVEDLLLDIGKTNEKSIYMTFGELTLLIPTEKEVVTEVKEVIKEVEKNLIAQNEENGSRDPWSTGNKHCTDHKGIEYRSYRARARAYHLNPGTIEYRLDQGMSLKEALETPKRTGSKKKSVSKSSTIVD